jgi:ABC-type Fe3+-siderophore transport system permease subunit
VFLRAVAGFGAAQVPLDKVMQIVGEQLGLTQTGDFSRGQAQIVWQIRARRVLLARWSARAWRWSVAPCRR